MSGICNFFTGSEDTVRKLRSLYQSRGYSQYKMSKFEEYDLYVKNKNFLISDSVITFTDTNGKLMALKPDVTLSIVKNCKDIPGVVQKVYYNENVYRVSAGNNAFKEIMQTGLECIGDIDGYSIFEVANLARASLECISPDYVLDISHVGIVSSVLDMLDVPPAAKKGLIKCVGEKNLHGIDEILREEGIPLEKGEPLKKLVKAYGNPREVIGELKGVLEGEAELAALCELEGITSMLAKAAGCEAKIRVDFSVVEDIKYYSGIVFKGFINGIPSAVVSGGRYDNLMKKMGKKSGAVGFAVYLDLLEELKTEGAEYDVDTVIIYGVDTDISSVAEAIDKCISEGRSAMALKSLPDKIKYKRKIML